MPPLSDSCVESALPTTPLPMLAVVIERVGAVMLSVNACKEESGVVAASVTFTVKFELPTAVAVPEINPAEDSVIPTGNDPLVSVHVSGALPPVATNCTL